MIEKLFYSGDIQIFVIYNGEIIYGPRCFSHYEWLVEQGILNAIDYNMLVRGHIDKNGIYFYTKSYETNDKVEYMAKKHCNEISKTLPVYCGCIINESINEFKPIKQLR